MSIGMATRNETPWWIAVPKKMKFEDLTPVRHSVVVLITLCLTAIGTLGYTQQAANNKGVWSKHIYSAESCFEKGQLAEAEELFSQALSAIDAKLNESTKEQSPVNLELKRDQRRCLFVLPQVYRLQGQRADALRLALRYRAELRGQKLLDDVIVENELNIAEDYVATGEHFAARQLLQGLLNNRVEILKPMPKLKCLSILATLEGVAGEQRAAQKLWESSRNEADQLLKKSQLSPNDQLYCLGQIAQYHESAGNAVQANKIVDAMQGSCHDFGGRWVP